MAVLLFFALFLSLTTYSSGTYCICKDGAQDPTAYNKVIDYACGAGADCKAIQPGGACYVQDNPKAICDYAVNSYFQNKGQIQDSCVFSGAATPSNNLPSTVPSGCTFPTSGSPVSPGTGGGGGGGGGGGMGGSGIPSSTPGGITTGTSTPGGSTTGFNGQSPPGGFSSGLGPTGGMPDYNSNASSSTLKHIQGTFLSLTLILLLVVCA